jgi:hypothetical protein
MIVTLRNGASAEVGLVGADDILGLPLVFGADQSDFEGMVQCAGTALQIETKALQEAQQ